MAWSKLALIAFRLCDVTLLVPFCASSNNLSFRIWAPTIVPMMLLQLQEHSSLFRESLHMVLSIWQHCLGKRFGKIAFVLVNFLWLELDKWHNTLGVKILDFLHFSHVSFVISHVTREWNWTHLVFMKDLQLVIHIRLWFSNLNLPEEMLVRESCG